MCKARDQSSPHWISRDRNNNRDRTGCLFGSLSGRRVHRDDDIHIETDELRSERRETVNLTFRVSVLDADALSFDPSEVPETLSECIYLSGDGGVGVACQKAYSRAFADCCWASATSGHATAAPLKNVMNSRRRISAPKLRRQDC